MWKAVKEFVLSCDTRSISKNPRYRPYGILQPLPIRRQPWSSISMDLITDLPSSRNFDAIFVIVDQLTMMAFFVPYKKTITWEEIARLFVNNVYQYLRLFDDTYQIQDHNLSPNFGDLSLKFSS